MTLNFLIQRTRHSADNSCFPSETNPSNERHLKSHYQMRQQSRKGYQLFLLPSKVSKQLPFRSFSTNKTVTPQREQKLEESKLTNSLQKLRIT